MEQKVKVLVYYVSGKVEEKITNTFEDFQEIVKGNFEYVDLGLISGYKELYGYDLFCNEVGKYLNLPMNKVFKNDIIHGNFIISKANEIGDQISLTEEDIEFIKRSIRVI